MKPFTKGLLLLTGFAVPTALAAIFVFGCCILPFHKYLHGAMPLCHLASTVLAGHHDGDDHGDDQPATAPPAREKLSAGPLTAEMASATRVPVTAEGSRRPFASVRSDPRSIMSQGAVRCESDVGLHLLHTAFRI